MDFQFTEKTKKRLIALLLLVSCVISGLLLAFLPDPAYRNLRSFGQADTLIHRTLNEFGISENQVRETVIRVDSNLVRKNLRVNLPPRFPKTMLHAELNRTFSDLSVQTPATVELPERDMVIQLLYKGTVFRSIDLQTDPNLTRKRNYASLLVVFDTPPSRRALDRVAVMGEPIIVVVQVSSPEEALEAQREMELSYNRICYWLQENGEQSFPSLQQLREFRPRTRILSFGDQPSDGTPGGGSSAVKVAADKNITFVDASSARILDSDLGETVFRQELVKYEQQAVDGEHPVAIVMADDRALGWLEEKLSELKKRGLYLTEPPEINY